MTAEDEPDRDNELKQTKAPREPVSSSPPVLSYASPGIGGRLVTVGRFRPMEAELARVKLESEGIRCIVLDQNMSIAHPLLFSEVPLQVMEDDLEQARQILARPVANDESGEYVDEDWRCPQCHRKTLDVLPLSPGWRRLRMLGRLLWLVPLLVLLLRSGASDESAEWLNWIFFPWVLVMATITGLVWTAKRDKRCRECGFVWRASEG